MPKLVAMMVVRNEANRYLRMCLNDLVQYVDKIVIMDDGSTDNTPNICSSYRKVDLIRNNHSQFWVDESVLRKKCWEATVAHHPDWILAIDADEMIENKMKTMVTRLIRQPAHSRIEFQRVEFWGSLTHYRIDKLWNPENFWGVYMIRYYPGYSYKWSDQPLHGGRLPMNLPGSILRSGLRLKHYGYANPVDQKRKYEAYIARDPQGKYCPLSHYLSILDPDPVLRRWYEPRVGGGYFHATAR